jgi:hypothetical protein
VRTELERQEWIAACERVQGRLSAALIAVGDRLSRSDADQIREFIDHNENGLAFEGLLLAHAERGLTIDESAGAVIDLAAREMNIEMGLWRLPLDPLLSKLREIGLT